jgi:hypothetical protein
MSMLSWYHISQFMSMLSWYHTSQSRIWSRSKGGVRRGFPTKFNNKCLSSYRTTQVSSLSFLDLGLCSSNNSVRGVNFTTKDTAKIQEKLKGETNWIEYNGLRKHSLSYRLPPLIAIRLSYRLQPMIAIRLSYSLPPLTAILLLLFTDVGYWQKFVTNQGFQLLIRYICFRAGVEVNDRDASFTDQELQCWVVICYWSAKWFSKVCERFS